MTERDEAAAWWANDPHWYPQGTPPRQGNRLAILIDGRAAMLEMYRAILGATDYVYLADWSLNPELELVRGPDQASVPPVLDAEGRPSYRLRDVLAHVADRADVRVLVWQGLLFFRPRRQFVYQARAVLNGAHPNIAVVVDATEPFGHSHHQKFLVVDGRIAFVSGLDFTDFDADRWDTSLHPVRDGRNWHDVTCRIEGRCVADVQRNFADRWAVAAGSPRLRLLESPAPEGTVPAQITRTVPAHAYRYVADGEEGILHAYLEAIARAERFIYIENQYLWSPRVTDGLIAALEQPRQRPFQIAIVLPVRPNIGKTDTDRNVRRLLAADRGRGRARVYSLYTWGRPRPHAPLTYKPIYVHAKLMIVDDAWLTMGSANLNTRSLVTDTELNVLLHDDTIARQVRLDLWSEHLLRPADELRGADPLQLLQHTWPHLARAGEYNLRRRREPLPSRVVPYPLGVVLSGVVKGKGRSGVPWHDGVDE